MSLAPQRLLGFAFASSDLLIEVSRAGQIAFAIGASEALSGNAETELAGRAWRDFIDVRDRPMVQALFDGLADGRRAGPIVVTLATPTGSPERAAALCAFCLPGNEGAISCAFTRAAPKTSHGLHDKSAFEAVAAALFETAKTTGIELELALVEMGGLEGLRKRIGPEAAKAIEQRLIGALRAQSHGGAAAAELGPDRFAVIRQQGESPETLTRRMLKLLNLSPTDGVAPVAAAIALKSDAGPGQVMRAIRYSLDSFIKDGMPGTPPASLDEAVARSVQRTLTDVGILGDAVSGRNFRLVFQPVVDLKAKNAVHHHEVLVRFGDNASPFPMIRMAEELDLIEPLDIAVVEQTIERLVADPSLKLAANISGRTITSSAFVEAVKKMLVARPAATGRLLFELTESAAIEDMQLADRHLQALRAEGCLICLDDFGAGAASLAYLQQLSLDIVKIDGRYIRELQHGGRESTFIRHLVFMCGELGVKTLAEMVESPQAEEAVRKAGVDYAQGWLYGAPTDIPLHPTATGAGGMGVRPALRRVGEVESWG
ncbi:MAG TPA: EAL domain-containing protein [Phenylobacterium sp.]|nr:EAL domain-containing protein [Phenylobacterium sp.]